MLVHLSRKVRLTTDRRVFCANAMGRRRNPPDVGGECADYMMGNGPARYGQATGMPRETGISARFGCKTLTPKP
jgi:hypothetical protein